MTEQLPFRGRVKNWKHDRGFGSIRGDTDGVKPAKKRADLCVALALGVKQPSVPNRWWPAAALPRPACRGEGNSLPQAPPGRAHKVTGLGRHLADFLDD
jgi:hypothetical protein